MTDQAENQGTSGFGGLDRLLHEPSRMSIVALLYMLESADFTFVMNQTNLTWGNLSSHLAKLEEAGYVKIEKGYKGKRPNTVLRLTEEGRESFRQYVQTVRGLFGNLPV